MAAALIFALMFLGGVLGDAGYSYRGPLLQGLGASEASLASASSGVPEFVQPQGPPGLEPAFGQLVQAFANSAGGASLNSLGAAPEVHKHIYVHVPPPEAPAPAPALAPLAPQRHYKIIFVKVPAPPVPSPVVQQLAQKPQIEEKTIVYVLVSKPDPSQLIPLPTPPPPPPSKPEVYFIKYSTQRGRPQEAGPAPGDVAEASSASGTALHADYGPPPPEPY